MLAENWLLIFGIPLIIVLCVFAWRRTRAIKARIAEVQEEMARNPQAPYALLAELLEKRHSHGKRTD